MKMITASVVRISEMLISISNGKVIKVLFIPSYFILDIRFVKSLVTNMSKAHSGPSLEVCSTLILVEE